MQMPTPARLNCAGVSAAGELGGGAEDGPPEVPPNAVIPTAIAPKPTASITPNSATGLRRSDTTTKLSGSRLLRQPPIRGTLKLAGLLGELELER
jgi:hypothetical protein